MKWITSIEEISNQVYRLRMVHTSGACIEKTGFDIEKMKEEALKDSLQMESVIEDKIKKPTHK